MSWVVFASLIDESTIYYHVLYQEGYFAALVGAVKDPDATHRLKVVRQNGSQLIGE